MKKIHTRVKRRKGLTTSFRHLLGGKTAPSTRPKTYKTEESAHAAAKKQGLAEDSYTLEKAKRNKKFVIVQEI